MVKIKKEGQAKQEPQGCAHSWEDEGYEYDGEDIKINAKCSKCSARGVSKYIFVGQEVFDPAGKVIEKWS